MWNDHRHDNNSHPYLNFTPCGEKIIYRHSRALGDVMVLELDNYYPGVQPLLSYISFKTSKYINTAISMMAVELMIARFNESLFRFQAHCEGGGGVRML